jgi:SAM-dependent MidA family methyltransferase
MTLGRKSAESAGSQRSHPEETRPAPSLTPLESHLIQHIDSLIQSGGGRISFHDFMRAALYHPQHGYYKRDTSPIGLEGDYFTAISATPVFGKILAGYIRRLRDRMGDPDRFTVIEFGGHRGRLRADVLAEAPGLDYRIVEEGDAWPEDIVGCVLSNEFLDALPVHRVAVVGGQWQELFVTRAQGGFAWQAGPLSDPRLAAALAGLPTEHMESYETEVNLRAIDWMAELGCRVRRGCVVTIDYGFERTDYFSPQRPRGTLRCYSKHRMNDEPLSNVGGQDITAHIEFTSLIEAGRQAGLEPVHFSDLAHFLVAEGADVIREISERTAGALSRERQALHQLLHPALMGSSFRVLVQSKGL